MPQVDTLYCFNDHLYYLHNKYNPVHRITKETLFVVTDFSFY